MADRPPLAYEVATEASRGSFFSGVGGHERDRAVSVPKKIILRPHFKKENLRLFGGGREPGGGKGRMENQRQREGWTQVA